MLGLSKKSIEDFLFCYFRLCLGIWRGRKGKTLRGAIYEEKWRNLSNL